MSTIHRVKDDLGTFKNKIIDHLNSEKFIVSQEWLITPENKTSFPNSSKPGVYIFTDENDNILYVGKASSGLGQRLGNGYIDRYCNIKDSKISGAKKLFTIAVSEKFSFLAPAIEEFLIKELNPPINKISKKS